MQNSETAAADIRVRVAEMLHGRMSGKIDRMLQYLTPTTMIHCASSREGVLPPGVWTGADGLRLVTRINDENYQPLDYEILDIVIDGERSVVRWRGDWRRHANGKIYTMEAAHFLRWRNGRVVEMHEFFDRASRDFPPMLAPFDVMGDRCPGLPREDIARCARALVTFPMTGPEIGLIRDFCSPDIVCDFVGDPARIPYAGRHAGVEALINIVRAVAVDFEQTRCDVAEMLVDG
jgi:ketosteroid isomerase-like protein